MVVLLDQQPKQVNDGISGRLVLDMADGGVLKELVTATRHTAVGRDVGRKEEVEAHCGAICVHSEPKVFLV